MIVRLFFVLVGAAGFSGFIVPVIRRRILNIGNASGIAICMCLMLYAAFMKCCVRSGGKQSEKSS